MGIVDQFLITIKCPRCSTIEEGKFLEKGSTLSGSSWSDRTNFKKFNVTWLDTAENSPPSVVKATCVECATDADVSSSFKF